MFRNPYREFNYGFSLMMSSIKTWFKILFNHPKCILIGHDWNHVEMSEYTDWMECDRCGIKD